MSQNLHSLRYSIVPAGFGFEKYTGQNMESSKKLKNNDSTSFRSFIAFGRWNIVFEEASFLRHPLLNLFPQICHHWSETDSWCGSGVGSHTFDAHIGTGRHP